MAGIDDITGKTWVLGTDRDADRPRARIYRPKGTAVPRSRGYEELRLDPDGTGTALVPDRGDRLHPEAFTWAADPDGAKVRLDEGRKGAFRVVRCDAECLVIEFE